MKIRKYSLIIFIGLVGGGIMPIFSGITTQALSAERRATHRPHIDPSTARMVGFVILPNKERRAIIDAGENKPYIFKLGDEVILRNESARVVEITEDQLVFEIEPTGGSNKVRKTLIITSPETASNP
ncbi:MAG TPA: hypothetical protein VNM22_10600 [Candidatus Limnocylindrales bacterium]|nr:hypothetical protein [Candidatus Limnocylindrales bacterium]